MTNETQSTNPIKSTKSRRLFRFRLRTLLILVTFLSVPLGWVGWELDQRRREKEVVDWVEENGGFVQLFNWTKERGWWEKTKDNWLGERVRKVYLNNPQLSTLSPLAELKKLERLVIEETQVNDLSPLEELKNLEMIDFRGTHIDRLQVLDLQQALPNCMIGSNSEPLH